MTILGVGIAGEGVGVRVGVKGSIAETTENFTKMLTLGLVII